MKRILVIDDEPDLRELVRINLDQAGYSVDTVSTGREALHALRHSPPDLVVLDLMLPDVSGTELCRKIRSDPALAEIPVIMLTAKAAEVDRVVGFELGAEAEDFGRERLARRKRGAAPRQGERAQQQPGELTSARPWDGQRPWTGGLSPAPRRASS